MIYVKQSDEKFLLLPSFNSSNKNWLAGNVPQLVEFLLNMHETQHPIN